MLKRKKQVPGRKKKDGARGGAAARTEETEDNGPAGRENVNNHQLEPPPNAPPQDGHRNPVKIDTEMKEEHQSNVQRTARRPIEDQEVASSSKQADSALTSLKQKRLEALKKSNRNEEMASKFPHKGTTVNTADGQNVVSATTTKTDKEPNKASSKPNPATQVPHGKSHQPDQHAPLDTNHRSDPAHVPPGTNQKLDPDNIPATTDLKSDPGNIPADTSHKPGPENIQTDGNLKVDPDNIQSDIANKSNPDNIVTSSVVKPDTRYVIPSRDYRNDPRYLAYIRSQGIDPAKLKPTRIKRRYPRYGYREGWVPKSQAWFLICIVCSGLMSFVMGFGDNNIRCNKMELSV